MGDFPDHQNNKLGQFLEYLILDIGLKSLDDWVAFFGVTKTVLVNWMSGYQPIPSPGQLASLRSELIKRSKTNSTAAIVMYKFEDLIKLSVHKITPLHENITKHRPYVQCLSDYIYCLVLDGVWRELESKNLNKAQRDLEFRRLADKCRDINDKR